MADQRASANGSRSDVILLSSTIACITKSEFGDYAIKS
jgi:hypothetical protein